ncbi:MAG: MgtC/SapB family protein [Patescibacteria group bacterium]
MPNFLFITEKEIVLKLILATVLGMLIGLERRLSHKEAGLRTFSLVSLGSALFVILGNDIIPKYWFNLVGASIDPTRVLSQLIVGLGFLGAGLIIFHEKKLHGLTTAATVWVSSAIGAAVGLGAYISAITATLIVLFVLIILWRLEKQLKISEDEY